MPRETKTEEIKVRVTASMKDAIADEMERRQQAESVIIRDALALYFGKKLTPGQMPLLAAEAPQADFGAVERVTAVASTLPPALARAKAHILSVESTRRKRGHRPKT